MSTDSPALAACVFVEFGTGCLFLHAAISKAFHPELTFPVLRALRLPAPRWALATLVLFEASLGFALCAGWRLQLTVPLAMAALVGFTGALLNLRLHGHSDGCGCSAIGVAIPPELRNTFFLIALAASVWLRASVTNFVSSHDRISAALFAGLSILAVSAVLHARRGRFVLEKGPG